jgi:hypothetical protein
MMFRSFVRPLLVALSLAFATTAAAPAFAEGAGAKAAEHKGGKHKNKGDKGDKAKHFPMTADKFTKMVDGRITKAKEKLTGALTKHKVEDAKKTQILKDFDDGAATVKAAAKRVGKDGEVTKDEAKEVRGLVKTFRQQMRSKYAPKKAEKAKAKDV